MKGKRRGSEGWCQAEEAFRIPKDTKDMGTICSEQVPAKAPYRHKISQCKPLPENSQWADVEGGTAERI